MRDLDISRAAFDERDRMTEAFDKVTFVRYTFIEICVFESFPQQFDSKCLRRQGSSEIFAIKRSRDLTAAGGLDRIRHRPDQASGAGFLRF